MDPIVILILLVVLLWGSLGGYRSSMCGGSPCGDGLGVVLVIVVALLVMGRL